MKSLCAILALFSLILFAKTIESRRDVGKYWKNVMKEQPMPQAIEGLLIDISDSTPKEKADCHEKVKKPFVEVEVEVEEFEPRPNVSSYNDDETKAELSSKDNAGPKAKQSFAAKEDKQPFEEDFEPRPNVSVYND
ncbi:organ-specific protein S2 [Prunus persica]|uniref:organ-specific protein S2 n=1 Tax=Prunus persica TaxID=3760 RepID=UPI0009AB5C97|nr:organ-specific protein S2 [Prunus persica]